MQKFFFTRFAKIANKFCLNFKNTKKRLALSRFFTKFLLSLCLFFCSAFSANATSINLIIDDLGYAKTMDKKFIDLNYPNIVFSFLPDATFTPYLSNYAHQNGKTLLIHMPMEANQEVKQERSTLKISMSGEEIFANLDYAFSRIPNAVGLNGHQGSLFTSDRESMKILMQWLDTKGLYFIDSRTTKYTQAAKVANEYKIPNISRQVFLDHKTDEASIKKEWQRLLRISKKYGNAIAIAHPHATTLKVLQEELPKLKNQNVKIANLDFSIKSKNPKNWQNFYAKNRISTGALLTKTKNNKNNLFAQNSNFARKSINMQTEKSTSLNINTSQISRSAPNISPNNDAYFFTTPYQLPKIIAEPLDSSIIDFARNTNIENQNNFSQNQIAKKPNTKNKNYIYSRDYIQSKNLTNKSARDLSASRNFVEKRAQNQKLTKFSTPKPSFNRDIKTRSLDTKTGIQRRAWTPDRRKID